MNLLAEPEHHKKARVRRARGFLLKAFSNATRHAFLRPQALIPAVASEKALASSGHSSVPIGPLIAANAFQQLPSQGFALYNFRSSRDRVLCDAWGRRDGMGEHHADSVLRP
jgi:hypothetical protein